MHFYPATIVAVTAESATVRFDSNDHEIVFRHSSHNAVPADLRTVGTKGFVSFPKAPAVFTADRLANANAA